MNSAFQLLFLLLIAGLVPSCQITKEYYQVYRTKSPQGDTTLIFQNDELKVSYDLWAEKGELWFRVENLRPHPVWVDQSKSYYKLNGDSSGSSEFSVTQGKAQDPYYEFHNARGKKKELPENRSRKGRYLSLPPDSTLLFRKQPVQDHHFDSTDLELGNREELRIGFSRKNTPLRFQNFLCYTADTSLPVRDTLFSAFHVHELILLEKNNFTGGWKEVRVPEGKAMVREYPFRSKNAYYLFVREWRQEAKRNLFFGSLGVVGIMVISTFAN